MLLVPNGRCVEHKLESLRWYLRQWAHWCRSWRPRGLWYPSAVPYLDEMRPGPSESSESLDGAESWQLHAVEQGVSELPSTLSGAIRAHYLAERALTQTAAAVDQAEKALIPLVERRHLIL